MFQKEIIPEKVTTYIGENHILLEIITVGILLLLILAALIQLSRIKKEVSRICKQVRKYLDVVLADNTEEEEEEAGAEEEYIEETVPEEKAQIKEIRTYQRKKEQSEPEKVQRKAEDSRQAQRDAELLMDVISDVF